MRYYKIGVVGNNWLIGLLVGWLVGWLGGWVRGWVFGNAIFSEKALRIFLIFFKTLGDFKGRKVTKPDY